MNCYYNYNCYYNILYLNSSFLVTKYFHYFVLGLTAKRKHTYDQHGIMMHQMSRTKLVSYKRLIVVYYFYFNKIKIKFKCICCSFAIIFFSKLFVFHNKLWWFDVIIFNDTAYWISINKSHFAVVIVHYCMWLETPAYAYPFRVAWSVTGKHRYLY